MSPVHLQDTQNENEKLTTEISVTKVSSQSLISRSSLAALLAMMPFGQALPGNLLSLYFDAQPQHTCHKLWTEICEIRQIFKGDLIKFCEIFTKITLELPQNSQKPLLKCKKLVINTTKCDLCLFLRKICCKMV